MTGLVLEAPLARGGMSVVWRARSRAEGAPLAVKLLPDAVSDALVDAILAEARAVAALDHPHVVWIHDTGRLTDPVPGLLPGTPWIAMELAEGSLADRPPRRWEDLSQVLAELLAGLAHAHARGIVHRDVKPSNVLVGTDRPGVKLSDFGVHGAPGTPIGGASPAYLAPEGWAGEPAGPALDLYAVGCVAVELATGAPPFPDRDPVAVGAAHARRAPPPLRPRFPVPAGFEGWVGWLLEKSAACRPVDAAEAARALCALGPAPPGPRAGAQAGGARAPEAPTTPAARRSARGPRRAAAPAPAGSEEEGRGPGRVPGPELGPGPGRLSDREPLSPTISERRSPSVEVALDSAGSRPGPELGPGPGVPALVGIGLGLVGLRRLRTQGRADEREQLRARLAAVVSGGSEVVRLDGPPGSGCRHLARALGEEASEQGVAAFVRGDAPAPAGRPVVRWVHAALPPAPGPRELVVCTGVDAAAAPGAVSIRVGPAPDAVVASVVRRTVALEPAVLAHVVAAAGGSIGAALATVRGWVQAGELHAGPDGLHWRGLATRLGPPPPEAVGGWLERAHVAILGGDTPGAAWILARTEPVATGRLRARWLVEQAQLCSVRGARERSLRFAQDCLEAVGGEPWHDERVAALLMCARAHLQAGRSAEATAAATEAASWADRTAVPGRSLARNLLAHLALAAGDPVAAERWCREALALALAAPNGGFDAVPNLLLLARLQEQRGDDPAAAFAQAEALAARTANPLLRAHVDAAVGEHQCARSPETAAPALRAALAVFDAHPHPGRFAVEALLAEACLASGDGPAAWGHAARVYATAVDRPIERAVSGLVMLAVAAAGPDARRLAEALERVRASGGATVPGPVPERLRERCRATAAPTWRAQVRAALAGG